MVRESTETFLAHRNLLFTVARGMLGSAAAAEEVLQETWLHWRTIDSEHVGDPRTHLIRILTRQSMHRLRSANHPGEYGPWLPESLQTAPDSHAELAETMSMALQLALDTLSPTERAVYILRDSFDLGYDEIAEAVGLTTPVVRDLAYRARRHITVRRPHRPVSPDRARAAAESLRRALDSGDTQALHDLLAPDAVLVSDAGGAGSPVRPITGAAKVARFVAAGLGVGAASLTCEPVDGAPALTVRADGAPHSVLAMALDGDRITGLYLVCGCCPKRSSARAGEDSPARADEGG
ncbi:sigma-70 family RNA polymerase sigma factor [Nocardia huaxiensis]|uniref:sigma-70 family RNA polymerase sigma factor n=1 Tax=Nocardia huaxiensis TaxID=2755382 RepID=UPI001E2F6D62|nr:sigma-70 family RNA polymerase sigma factor [Nocardia huaxiensis]UFS95993.1 sigma-70 family RNA polymerase sigma factor [Nocardia huaxiensis]